MQNYLNKLYDTNVRSRFKFQHNHIHPSYQQYTLHLKTAPIVQYLVLHIQEVLGSDLYLETVYPNRAVSWGILSSSKQIPG
jgi:hypothetical protein